jgi:PAS domain S-box-containing protein
MSRLNLIRRAQSASLIWKLVIPFLFFSFVGTTTLVYIGLASQQNLIKEEEKKEIQRFYKLFLSVIQQKKEQALSVATVVAADPEVEKFLAERDRKGLIDLLMPLYQKLEKNYGILQFHFHIPPGKSFLRLHRLNLFGEMMSYRKTPTEAMRTEKGVAGLEWGLAGLGIRGVAPIFYNGQLAGSVEIGFPFGKLFLDELKKNWGPDFTVYEKTAENIYTRLATSLKEGEVLSPAPYMESSSGDSPVILIAPPQFPHQSILLGPVKDYYGDVVAVVEIDVNRSAILERLAGTRNLMITVGVVGILLSFALTWLVASLFVRPIREIVKEAEEIAQGRRESRLAPRPNDEIGVLTRSLNTMLESLKERRRQIEEYAKTLELRVQHRTADLVASEEKYRTLVDNLPLIVYRILKDGTTEFINPHFTEKLGYTAEEVVGNRAFWWETICGHEIVPGESILTVCWEEGEEYRQERVVRDKAGRPLIFIDLAIPCMDEKGQVQWIDGIMMEITELKKLQERALRTEEIRTLGEISARFAHEIRNPLATAGGFARRLRDSLPGDDRNRRFAQIIVEEVARLEGILRIILSSIEPFQLCIANVNVNHLLESWVRDLEEEGGKRGIQLVASFSPSLPSIPADEGRLNRAFESLLKNAIATAPNGDKIFLSTAREGDALVVTIRHKAKALAEEDLEQFFFPRFSSQADPVVLDLPLSKVVIHRHGGKIDVFREPGEKIVIRVELPIKSPESMISPHAF